MPAVVALMLVGSWSAWAQATNAPSRLSYDSFRTISDRNIFNPNRYARGTVRPTPRASSQPAARVESFSLVGIMAYEKGIFAFFDGTKSEYKKALQPEGVIGDYKLINLTPAGVKLALGTNTVDLKVGMQMRREDEGDWFLSEGGSAAPRRVVSMRTRTRGGSRGENASINGQEFMDAVEPEIIVIDGENPSGFLPTENPAVHENGDQAGEGDSGGVTDPVLLRLMQRRQELNQ